MEVNKTRHASLSGITKWLRPNPRLKDTQYAIAQEVFDLATRIELLIPEDSAELTAGMRKLLEAKDCFVRASLEPLQEERADTSGGPHSEACRVFNHPHGFQCAATCPTCHGQQFTNE